MNGPQFAYFSRIDIDFYFDFTYPIPNTGNYLHKMFATKQQNNKTTKQQNNKTTKQQRSY